MFKAGITETKVPQGFSARLNDHKIIADSAIILDTDMKHFEWGFTPLTNHIRTNDTQEVFHSMAGSLRISHMTLADVLICYRTSKAKKTPAAEEELMPSTCHFQDAYCPFSMLFSMVYSALALSFLNLLITTSLRICFREALRGLYTLALDSL